jgi:hypothetical protein
VTVPGRRTRNKGVFAVSTAHEIAPANGQPVAAARPNLVVIRPGALGEGVPQQQLKKVVPAWVISLGVHVIIIAVFFLGISFSGSAAAVMTPINTEVAMEDQLDQKNLIEPTVGEDPERTAEAEVDRKEDVTVAAVARPEEQLGLADAKDNTPVDIPPPPSLSPTAGTGRAEGTDGAAVNVGDIGGGFMGNNPLTAAFAGRSGARKSELVRAGGGNSESEACVARGLIWLAKQQKPNGSWMTDGTARDDIAATGIALLPFLAAGQTHKADPKVDKYVKKEYVAAVDAGLRYLISKQKPNGSFNHNSYSQAIATMALCEAYGMTRDPKLQYPAQQALKYIEECQHPLGGWRYQPKQPGDTSVTGWQLQALKSGKMAKLSVDDGKMKLVGSFLDSVAGNYGATYGYMEKTARPSTTAVGLLCRQYLGWGPNNPHLAEGVEFLKKFPPQETGRYDIYYFYYATQVVHFFGGDDWSKFWNPKMRDLLIKKQVKTGNINLNGSWDPDDSHTGQYGGRLVCTCLSLLTLEVYYRHLPLYKRTSSGISSLES